jgi:tripartite-type tricarboxylate transporter receptor subunit TctC
MIEAGYKDFVSDTFNAILAPARVPQPILDLLVQESRAAMQRPEVRDLSRKQGYEVVGGTPEQLTARIKAEIAGVRELVQRAGIIPQ